MQIYSTLMMFDSAFALKGWRRRGLLALLGACATAALPPVYFLPLLVPAFAGLFLMVNAAPTRRQAFWDGWWWGFGHFVTGLYWMCISLYVDPEQFAWLTPFALFGVPSVIAIYIGLVTLAIFVISRRVSNPLDSIIAFAVLWVLVEYARAHLFTGFPWNLIGYVWTVSDATLQLASVTGIYGLSWLTVIVSTMPALFVLKAASARRSNISSCALLLMMLDFGLWRLDHYPLQLTDTHIRIVQANIQESKTWSAEHEAANLKKMVDLTRRPGLDSTDIVIWPEAAVPFYITPDSDLLNQLGGILPQKTLLITGGLRGQGTDKRSWHAWNTLFAIDHDGHIVSQYDKHHLVPFGEFIPFRQFLPIENIAGGMGDFSRGAGPETLNSGKYAPYSPLICYEAIFPDEATDGSHRARWLVNITNDAWFGISSGPWQHLQMARTRAVEQGIPLVRAANTGISVVYDALGRKISSLPLGTQGVLDARLPEALDAKASISSLAGLSILSIIVLSVLFIMFIN